MSAAVSPASTAAPALRRPALIADIGGTNARFALTDLDAPRPDMHHVRSLPCGEFGSLQHAAETYLADLGLKPTRAAIDIVTSSVTTIAIIATIAVTNAHAIGTIAGIAAIIAVAGRNGVITTRCASAADRVS